MLVCQNCGRDNYEEQGYCLYCGEILDLPFSTTKLLPDDEQAQASPQPRWGSLSAEADVVQLHIDEPKEAVMTIGLKQGEKIILGRQLDTDTLDKEEYSTVPVVTEDFRKQLIQMALLDKEERERIEAIQKSDLTIVDLEAYGAADFGVSRKHAVIEREERYFTLTDLGSTNGTRLNGMTLVAYQRRVLRDGDELRLGKLVMRVVLEQQ